MIKWENKEEGVFRIVNSKKVAQLWGSHKRNPNMNYDKLARGMRYCIKSYKIYNSIKLIHYKIILKVMLSYVVCKIVYRVFRIFVVGVFSATWRRILTDSSEP